MTRECRPESPKWPARLKALCLELQSAGDEAPLEKTHWEAWKIINRALAIYVRFHSARLGEVSEEEVEDMTAEKSLDLLHRIVKGKTDIAGRSVPEIIGFLSTVARNDLLDLLKGRGRMVEPQRDDKPEWDVGRMAEPTTISKIDPPDLAVERKDFARALRRCAERLDKRARLVWFFRVFYSMPSKEIAAHPEIGIRVSHVDVLLQRTRRMIRDCMQEHGYEPQDMPPGAFVELWEAFRMGAIAA